MTTPGTEKSREGKYCPRCRTMALRDRETCEHCGHQFRTGLGTGLSASSLDAPLMDEAALNRTRQFTLPPLTPRGDVSPPQVEPAGISERIAPPKRGLSVFALALSLVGLAVLGTWSYLQFAPTAQAARPSPVGRWETAQAGRPSQGAHMEFFFREGGDGAFSWAAGGPHPLSGQTPLHWRLDADGKLVLDILAPTATDPASGPIITHFNSQPWLWRVDRPQHRLIIGTLNLMEKT